MGLVGKPKTVLDDHSCLYTDRRRTSFSAHGTNCNATGGVVHVTSLDDACERCVMSVCIGCYNNTSFTMRRSRQRSLWGTHFSQTIRRALEAMDTFKGSMGGRAQHGCVSGPNHSSSLQYNYRLGHTSRRCHTTTKSRKHVF